MGVPSIILLPVCHCCERISLMVLQPLDVSPVKGQRSAASCLLRKEAGSGRACLHTEQGLTPIMID